MTKSFKVTVSLYIDAETDDEAVDKVDKAFAIHAEEIGSEIDDIDCEMVEDYDK